MRASAFLYPWDVNGDPEAPARVADLGVAQVTLAAAYHSTRALTPRHPRHRVVTAEHAAVLYPPDADRWQNRALRPYGSGDWAPGDAYGEAAAALTDAGLKVHTWVVLAHNSRLGAEHPHTSVVNAYGDRYPWAPCIARPATRAYLTGLAAEAAVRPGAHGTELESLGWYGLAHLHAHDKTGGVGLGDAGQYLMSLCFCPDCRAGYGAQGLDAEELAAAVRTALEPVWRGAAPSDGGWAGVEKLLGAAPANATRAWRDDRARTLQEAAVSAVRAAAPDGFQVLLHADPVSYHCGANAGVDPAHILSVADGVVVPCTGGAGLLTPFAERAGEGTVLAANLTVVSGMGGSPRTLAADAARARDLGATELRLYHAGLASDGDLEGVRAGLATLA
ncbi:Alanine-rich protein OS=Streptomyces tendae OX=1932 GN=GUR47_13100 PE=4 SV=1 [Streptomyces tendae]